MWYELIILFFARIYSFSEISPRRTIFLSTAIFLLNSRHFPASIWYHSIATEDGLTKIETTFDEDTVWLSIDQMAELFQRDRSVIGKHICNIFKEGELDKNSVWAKFAYTATDVKKYTVDYYNLDVIISVQLYFYNVFH